MVQFPLELVDAILENLTNDKSALATCSLVCKAWIHPSRRLLFNAVDINHLNVNWLLGATSPISPYIRRLRLVGNFPLLWNETFPRLQSLKNLRSLTITSLQLPWPIAPPETVFSNCNTVVRLHLYFVQFIAFAQFAHIVCAFRELNTLVITRSTWSWPDPPSPTSLGSPLQNLRHLELRDCDWVTIFQWLLSCGDHIPTLQALYVRGSHHRQGDTSAMSRFLQALGPHLETLWLGPDINDNEFIIGEVHNPCLRSLTLHFWQEPQNPLYISHLLSRFDSCGLEEISVGLLLVSNEPGVVDWNDVDAILAQPQFSTLRKLRVGTKGDHSAWFVDRLPQSYARGILSVESFQWELTIL